MKKDHGENKKIEKIPQINEDNCKDMTLPVKIRRLRSSK